MRILCRINFHDWIQWQWTAATKYSHQNGAPSERIAGQIRWCASCGFGQVRSFNNMSYALPAGVEFKELGANSTTK